MKFRDLGLEHFSFRATNLGNQISQLFPQGTFQYHFCITISNFASILFFSPLNSNRVVTTIFCIWHNNTVLVPYENICSNLNDKHGISTNWNFHKIWNLAWKIISKMVPWTGMDLSIIAVCTVTNKHYWLSGATLSFIAKHACSDQHFEAWTE